MRSPRPLRKLRLRPRPRRRSRPQLPPPLPAAADEPESYARIRAFVSGLLEHMGIQAEIEITARENGGVNVNLSGSNMGAVILPPRRDARRDPAPDQLRHQPRQR